MYCIGLTGTVASGKSAAIKFFKSQGIETISADEIAKQLTQKNTPALKDIADYFGQYILDAQGELKRRELRCHILTNTKDRRWLEAYLHPKIRQQIEYDITQCKSPYCVIEIPLLLNRSHYPYLNRVLLITAPPKHQIERLMARDKCTEAEAVTLLEYQEKTNHRAALADDIIENNDSIEQFNLKLAALHQQYLSAS
jgi:dephospho-CoA kinase